MNMRNKRGAIYAHVTGKAELDCRNQYRQAKRCTQQPPKKIEKKKKMAPKGLKNKGWFAHAFEKNLEGGRKTKIKAGWLLRVLSLCGILVLTKVLH